MLLRIHPETPAARQIARVVDCLERGGVIIYPTDTIYGMACNIYKPKAIERIAKIKGLIKSKADFSFVFNDLSHLSEYTLPINNQVYKLMKKSLPGPYTFILNANNKIPKIFQTNKKTVGIRIPENNIPQEIVRELGHPIMTSSIREEDEVTEYLTDPELIYEKYQGLVDIVIDGGHGDNEPSTIIDCTGEEIEVIREGKGAII